MRENALDDLEKERDDFRGRCLANAMELEVTISERDDAIKAGLTLTVEKDRLQVEIERLKAENAAKDKEIAALTAKIQELEESDLPFYKRVKRWS